MNFFKSQDAARKNTKLLVFLFISAVFILIAMTNLLVIGFAAFSQSPTITATELKNQFEWETFLLVSAGVISLIFIASLYKIIQLSGGGSRVAEMMDAELIADHQGDLYKRRVLNVVEEMAIASGNPVPPVYLMQDDAINAFAAGTTAGNAVIGVTTGTIKKLTREQLQGVIAHEFSHIHNGDMRLNIRLIGILNGILVIGIIGRLLLRPSSRRSHSRNSKGGGAIVILGLGLLVIGYAGVFFGNIIKAAVSRQREYLADASAVQFTRNPDGISGALKRIGGNTNGSILIASEAEEVSHALFSEGITTLFTGLFATHPPLEKRIRAVQPYWDGEFEIPPENDPILESETQTQTIDEREKLKQAVITGATVMAGQAAMADVIDSIGQPTDSQLKYAQELIATIPEILIEAARSPYAARAVIYYLVLDSDEAMRQQQFRYLLENADTGIHDETLNLYAKEHELETLYRLPLIEIALSSLQQLSARQYSMFKDNLDALISMDSKISLFEWSLQKIVLHHLASIYEKPEKLSQNKSLTRFKNECAVLLSFLIHAGKQDGISTDSVFETVKVKLDMPDIFLIDIKSLDLTELNTALDKLKRLKPLLKPKLLKACADCITADKKITMIEIELFRAIADILDCPMPPLYVKT